MIGRVQGRCADGDIRSSGVRDPGEIIITHSPILQILLQGAEAFRAWLDANTGQRIDLRNTDLRGFDLSGCDLRQAVLAGADLRGARLANTDLRHADLSQADLSGANLSGANLRGAKILEARFAGADIEGARFDRPPRDVGGTTTFSHDRGGTLIDTTGGPVDAEAANPMPEVRFTMYRPHRLCGNQSRKLIVIGHSCFDMNRVRQVYEDEFADSENRVREVQDDGQYAVDPQRTVTIKPEAAGIEFEPGTQTLDLDRDLAVARFQACCVARPVQDTVASGQIDISLGKLVICSLPLAFEICGAEARTESEQPPQGDWSGPYRRIFLSYSRRDSDIVEQCERYGSSMGDKYLRDVYSLRSGEVWQERLLQLIYKANIFQLFWSSNAMHSPHVRREYEYALSLKREKFIRPTYWETPFPEDGEKGLPPQSLRDLNFHFLGS